jgi:hypothetical protein
LGFSLTGFVAHDGAGENDVEDNTVTSSIFERHLQTAIQIILVALIIWAGQQLVNTSNRVVSLEVKVGALETHIRSATSELYTERQAQRDQALLWEAIRTCQQNTDRLRERVNAIDVRIKNVEALP